MNIVLGLEKISFKNEYNLIQKINKIEFTRILLIEPCTPECTDTNNWIKVYYEIETKTSA